MDTAEQAAIKSAARRVSRASGQLREAQRDLAALAGDGPSVLGTTTVHDADSAAAARELISLGVGRHGAVDVVVIARGGRPNPPRPARAKENHDGKAHAR